MAKFPTPGTMIHLVTLQDSSKVDDGGAGKRVAWHDVADVWAEVEPISSRERFYAHQVKAEISHRVKIRYRDGVKPSMRIRHEEKYYLIDSAIDMAGARRFLELLCTEVLG